MSASVAWIEVRVCHVCLDPFFLHSPHSLFFYFLTLMRAHLEVTGLLDNRNTLTIFYRNTRIQKYKHTGIIKEHKNTGSLRDKSIYVRNTFFKIIKLYTSIRIPTCKNKHTDAHTNTHTQTHKEREREEKI